MSVRTVAREEILTLKAYVAGAQIDDTIRLNANELPYSHSGNPALAALNRYPEVRPATLTARMADLYRVPPENLLVTRGSSEAIDVLIRSCCRAYRDSILIPSPTFGMYRLYADVQGAAVIEHSLDGDTSFELDPEALLSSCAGDTRLVFLCTPNNPTGQSLPADTVLGIAAALRGRSLVVADEAYVEFSERPSLAAEAVALDNLVVLRTLSKAHALAGARCGAAIGSRDLIELLSRVLPPYSFPIPVTRCVLQALEERDMAQSRRFVATIRQERERLRAALEAADGVRRVWPSDANFLLVEFDDVADAAARALSRKILIRRYEGQQELANCARITVGTPEQNSALLAALGPAGGQAGVT